jgi:hypothetical protein
VCNQLKYNYTALMAQKRGENLESAFTAVIEPYAGEPFITGLRPVQVAGNENDALKAVAVEVKTANGHTDLCFAEGRPEKARMIGPVSVSGEFACYSTDAQGLRLATLSGGTKLDTPLVRLAVDARERTGKVLAVDYAARTAQIDSHWPASVKPQTFEIGSEGHWTDYTASAVAPAAKGTTLTMQRGADYYRSKITRVAPEKTEVDCVLNIPLGKVAGYDRNIVASNDKQTKFWRAAHINGNDFTLAGSPVSEADFAPEGVLRLWEYGVGDTVRQSTFASLRRVDAGVYELTASAGVAVAFKGKGIETSPDGTKWTPAQASPQGEWVILKVAEGQAMDSPLFLRVR